MNGKLEQDVWNDVLGETNTLYVGVECRLDVLVEREKHRNDRIQGSAQEQAERVHEGVKYDLNVSTTADSAHECARTIAMHIANNPS